MTEIEYKYITEQKAICSQFETNYVANPFSDKIGVAIETFHQKTLPVHGLRHPIQSGGVANWYLWCGDYSEREDFFKPIHVHHLLEIYPLALKFLGLPPGWRFLTDGSYEDVWFDEKLLDI